MKINKYIAIGGIVLCITVVFLAFIFYTIYDSLHYTDSKLKRIAESAQPLIDALEEYKTKNYQYPKSLDDLPERGNNLNKYLRWVYYPSELDKPSPDYSISKSLGWDPSLTYRSEDKKWYYNHGDGRPEKEIKFNK